MSKQNFNLLPSHSRYNLKSIARIASRLRGRVIFQFISKLAIFRLSYLREQQHKMEKKRNCAVMDTVHGKRIYILKIDGFRLAANKSLRQAISRSDILYKSQISLDKFLRCMFSASRCSFVLHDKLCLFIGRSVTHHLFPMS